MSAQSPSDRNSRGRPEKRSRMAPILLGIGLAAVAAVCVLAWAARREQYVRFARRPSRTGGRWRVLANAGAATHGPVKPPPPPLYDDVF